MASRPRAAAHMRGRMLKATLWRKRGTAGLAVLALAIGGSVASALLHVSGDVSHKLTRELRSLGPNALLVPTGFDRGSSPGEEGVSARTGSLDFARAAEAAPGGGTVFVDERLARLRLREAGVPGALLLYVVARVGGQPVQVIGADLGAARSLHPSWKLDRAQPSSWMGIRLARRLGVRPGQTLVLEGANGRSIPIPVGALLDAGGPDDDAWWVPLRIAQELGGLVGRASLVQARIEGAPLAVRASERALERGGQLEVLTLRALSAAEAGLLERMRRLMSLVTLAALLAAGLCAFGTLTDLALERRREIALMKALGAARREIVRQFATESIAIGIMGGVAGWLLGLVMAQVIGRQVFHSAIGLRWDVPPLVIGLALLVAVIASLGPVRLALAVDPAVALKGD